MVVKWNNDKCKKIDLLFIFKFFKIYLYFQIFTKYISSLKCINGVQHLIFFLDNPN